MGRFKSAVTIDQKTLNRWQVLRTEEDAKVIAEKAGVTQQTVYNAFNVGEAQPRLYQIMDAYYEDKYQLMQQRLMDYAD